jgi:lysozyme family protein
MLFASHIDNFQDGAQFGAARTLVKGTDFNCNTAICYGIGAANHALFQQLQTTLNQYAKLGLSAYTSQLTVDGFIGANTVSAARAAAAAALLPSPGTTKEQVAANAQVLQSGLQAFLGGVNAPKPIAVSTSSTTTAPTATAPTRVVTPTTSTPIPQPSPQAAAAAASIPNLNPATIPSSPAAASLAPIVTTKKVPLWIWVTASAVGVLTIGAVGYAVLHKPAPKASFARRRRR